MCLLAVNYFLHGSMACDMNAKWLLYYCMLVYMCVYVYANLHYNANGI